MKERQGRGVSRTQYWFGEYCPFVASYGWARVEKITDGRAGRIYAAFVVVDRQSLMEERPTPCPRLSFRLHEELVLAAAGQ